MRSASPGRAVWWDDRAVLRVQNIYGHGFAAQVARLEGFGLALRAEASTYAGARLCRFIDFPAGPSLELIEVTDRSAYEAFVPAGMTPYAPGISLVAGDGSPATLDAYETGLSDFEPYRLHVPYSTELGPDSPGWHYLNFGMPLVRGTFVWLTAYDEPRPAPVAKPRHPGGFEGVAGLVFELDADELRPLSALVGTAPAGDELDVGGVRFIAAGSAGASDRFPLRTVVLRTDRAELVAEERLRIATNRLCWDLLATAES